ncbi:thiol:disulfide interchange protein DsbD [Holospora obtusa F1]|uniref:Thiol:disulfide interchange protein DsbD n=1 Tax=Holospora obtusa F1 TaxID=1399147 RepID=W6TE05_HOLOB|nr:thioredoxin family protein [Holospora obtusa]ETZ07323.1 thiol:disulfide interchange protein DsbD [Holospora obtusa F1]
MSLRKKQFFLFKIASFVLLFCFLSIFNLVASPESIIDLKWGEPTYETATYVKVPLKILIAPHWKLMGPNSIGDTLINPPKISWKNSKNISNVQVFWPATIAWFQENQRGQVYRHHVFAMLYVQLKDRNGGELNIEFQGQCCSSVCKVVRSSLSLPLNASQKFQGGIWKMLSFAFLGGAILNVMPCVLPVLGLKLKGLSKVSPFLLRRTFLMTSFGIFLGFWLLAIATILLKFVFQREVGWGIHLQNPYFLIALCLIMVVSSYSLLGLFQFNIPRWTLRFVPKDYRTSLGALGSGLLAVILATPCSAPFLGPALGYFLCGTAQEILYGYTAIALGFAFPYVIGFVFPIYRFLPKPGGWMVLLERLIGVSFLGAATWLVWWPLRSFLSGFMQQLALGLLVLMASVPLLHYFLTYRLSLLWRSILLFALPSIAGIGLFLLPFFSQQSTQKISMQDGKIHWISWSQSLMRQAIQAGRIVFIDVTGTGCLTCMLNKQVFLNPKIQTLLGKPNMVCMRADYSKGSDEITALLKSFSRAAIPFNVFISKDFPGGIVLSELLTVKEIEDVLILFNKKNQDFSTRTISFAFPFNKTFISKSKGVIEHV